MRLQPGGVSPAWLIETDSSPFCAGRSVLAIAIQPMRLCQTFVIKQTINYSITLLVVATDICCIHSFRRIKFNIMRFGNALIPFSYLVVHLLSAIVTLLSECYLKKSIVRLKPKLNCNSLSTIIRNNPHLYCIILCRFASYWVYVLYYCKDFSGLSEIFIKILLTYLLTHTHARTHSVRFRCSTEDPLKTPPKNSKKLLDWFRGSNFRGRRIVLEICRGVLSSWVICHISVQLIQAGQTHTHRKYYTQYEQHTDIVW